MYLQPSGAGVAIRRWCGVMRCCALCGSVTGEDRWPVSAPLAEGAQPRAGERTMDKRGGSEGKRSWEFPVWDRKRGNNVGQWYVCVVCVGGY